MVKTGVAGVDLKKHALDAKDWALEHPYQASFHIASGVIFFAPGLVTVPALGAAGYGAKGVAAGKFP